MFCPVCKAEYRYGFAECSDCGVALVEQLSDDSGVAARTIGNPDAMEVLWAGVDARTSSSIGSALDAAKIAYKEDSVESQLMPAFRQSIYRIRVRRGDFEAAVKSIRGLGGSDDLNSKSPSAILDRNSSFLNLLGIDRSLFNRGPIGGSSTPESTSDQPEAVPILEDDSEDAEPASDTAQDDLVEEFHPEDATAEVWSGEDAEMAENIRMCLREVGIGSELRQVNSKSGVYVLPQSEARAREIVREIVEDTPPE
jgi:hypothetical protein